MPRTPRISPRTVCDGRTDRASIWTAQTPQGFHFDASGAQGFGAGFAHHAGVGVVQLKADRHPGQRQGVAQGDEVAGFFCRHDAGQAGHAQHIAFFGVAMGNQLEGAGQHLYAALGHGHAVGVGLLRHVDHVGLAMGIKVGEFRHGVGANRVEKVRPVVGAGVTWPSYGHEHPLCPLPLDAPLLVCAACGRPFCRLAGPAPALVTGPRRGAIAPAQFGGCG